MLSSLHIRNYILIDSLDISFPEGLVIITGQTGAGKSILLGALSLLAGAKADGSLISEGADNCVVEAEFDIDDRRSAEILEENGVDWDGGHLIIRRLVNASGRSRSFVNDCPVSVSVLQELSERLIDIHSQHRSLILTDKAFQLSLLDRYAGNTARLDFCEAVWRDLQKLKSEYSALLEKKQRLFSEGEYNLAQFRQLSDARLKEGELEELEEEQKSLANAGQIKECLRMVLSVLNGDGEEERGVLSSLRESVRNLDHVSRYLPLAEKLAGRIESSRIELDDIASELSDVDSGIDMSAEHLEQVEDRLSELYSLLKKHNCRDIGELIRVRDGYAAVCGDMEGIDDRLSELQEKLSNAEKAYDRLASELHQSREAVASEFAAGILDSLVFLELDRARFEVELAESAPSASGRDSVIFKFSANGTVPVDVAKCASGGEMSRIMLCLKAMMAKYVGMPTLIFDEIDTGVSGSVADRMGQMICSMGSDMQVFSITHLPQVAAKGNAHYVVSKTVDAGGKAVSTIHKLSGEERVKEIARLLSGAMITEAAMANAESLLKEAR